MLVAAAIGERLPALGRIIGRIVASSSEDVEEAIGVTESRPLRAHTAATLFPMEGRTRDSACLRDLPYNRTDEHCNRLNTVRVVLSLPTHLKHATVSTRSAHVLCVRRRGAANDGI
jgi:hypothetical protein